MRHDPWLTEISPDDIKAAMQRKAAREALIVEQAAEITRLCASAEELKAALREMVYETTHLSPQEDDGSHWCKISKCALDKARAALEGKKDV